MFDRSSDPKRGDAASVVRVLGPSGRENGRLYSDFLKNGMFYSVVINAPFIGRVEKGVETFVYIAE